MNLDFLKDLENSIKNIDVQEFVDELSNYLENFKEKVDNKLSNQNQIEEKHIDNELSNFREENCLYQVIDRSSNGIYLQNTNNNIVFEEINIPQEIKDEIENDYILRYKNGTYIIEQELTDKFFDSLVDINEYKKIQENFIKESNITEIDSNTRYNILSKENEYTLLNYGNDEKNIIKVPNVLLPYFMNNETILYYENGKFHKDI